MGNSEKHRHCMSDGLASILLTQISLACSVDDEIGVIGVSEMLFRDCPEMIEKYPELHGMDDQEELRNSQFLQEHSQRVLDAFDHTIDSLDDVDYVIQLLKKIGQMHADLELKPDDMWKLEQPFLAAVAECLEDRYTPKFQEIYSKLITFIIEHVVNGFDPH
ncbi:hypothetical protein Bbelb_380780 [Branchiostoma belcheri]|nr:hypothetical protein Bbelb_380780 [Branchiostoma belcheri]